jgi:LysM repeat protein
MEVAAAASGPVRLRDDAPLRYTVKKGDTLWDLATYFLRDPWQWPELWYGNPQVKNPHLIYPGQRLTLVVVNGRTRLMADNTERLQPRAYDLPLDASVPAIPLEAIRNFLRGPRLVTREEAERSPYIVEFVNEHIVGGMNNEIWVKNLPQPAAATYSIVRVGDAYRDPDTKELLGYEALPAGEAELRRPGAIAQMQITKSISHEVLIADRLLPIEPESFEANFYPHAPAKPVDGRIISVYDGVNEITQYAIVALNRGSSQGIDPGTVLDIYQAGHPVADPYGKRALLLPESYAGKMMVFKVTPRLSYALVMSTTKALHVLDKVRNPEASPG